MCIDGGEIVSAERIMVEITGANCFGRMGEEETARVRVCAGGTNRVADGADTEGCPVRRWMQRVGPKLFCRASGHLRP